MTKPTQQPVDVAIEYVRVRDGGGGKKTVMLADEVILRRANDVFVTDFVYRLLRGVATVVWADRLRCKPEAATGTIATQAVDVDSLQKKIADLEAALDDSNGLAIAWAMHHAQTSGKTAEDFHPTHRKIVDAAFLLMGKKTFAEQIAANRKPPAAVSTEGGV